MPISTPPSLPSRLAKGENHRPVGSVSFRALHPGEEGMERAGGQGRGEWRLVTGLQRELRTLPGQLVETPAPQRVARISVPGHIRNTVVVIFGPAPRTRTRRINLI